MENEYVPTVKLEVKPITQEMANKGVAVLTPEAMATVDVEDGEYIRIVGPDDAWIIARVHRGSPTKSGIRIDGSYRKAACVDIGDTVTVTRATVAEADQVTIAIPNVDSHDNSGQQIRDGLLNRAVVKGQTLSVPLEIMSGTGQGTHTADSTHRILMSVVETTPAGPVVITDKTHIRIAREASDGPREGEAITELPTTPTAVTYDDIGGLDEELEQIREIVELPLHHPNPFHRLGVDPPRGVLLHGPPGTGKTRIVRAVATETDIHVETISGPTIASKYYGETEEQLREVFERAREHEPAIVFFDELDSIATKRGEATGDVEHRVVAQLLSLLDGMSGERQIVVVGTTNRVDAVDPALRRPGRFDREIEIGVPDRDGREEILRIHSRNVPLAPNVDLASYAERTHGFVGADLENLVRESVLQTLRRVRSGVDSEDTIDTEVLATLEITHADIDAALQRTEPSALREVFVEIPEVNWTDIGGLDDTKGRLQETVEWPLTYPEAFERVNLQPSTGILLYGPPGTGKTLLARAVANEAQSNFISIKGPELLDKYVGESEKGVREVFAKARENAPTVVFFDEIDAIAGEREGGVDSGVGERVVSQLLTELDGLEELEDVVVIATTNRPDLLDDALLRSGRFDRHIHVSVPDREARREIFAIHTRDTPLADDLDLDDLADQTEGYVGADIEAVCREASTAAVRDYVNSGGGNTDQIVLTTTHFEHALDHVEAGGSGGNRAQFDIHHDALE